jgi:hypothetical protein
MDAATVVAAAADHPRLQPARLAHGSCPAASPTAADRRTTAPRWACSVSIYTASQSQALNAAKVAHLCQHSPREAAPFG